MKRRAATLFSPLITVLLATVLPGSTAAIFAQTPVLDTPDKLWRDFRVDSPELEIQTLRRWHEDGVDFETLRFTAEREPEGRVRVFTIRGAPTAGGHLPGILHIHGGGQTASLEWVRFWARRGYVCVSFDFTGPWEGRKDVTDWGPIRQANLQHANGGLQIRPTPRASSWYHWALVARRALTVLSYHPKVDRDRLGIFGVSIGGTLCWLVAATDERVKTAVPIYGCGYNFDKRKTVWGFPELEPAVVLFKRVLAPEGYASSIRRPLLLLDATNDFHGWMDNAYEILGQVRSPWRVAFTPRYNHHIDGAQGKNLPAWMDWQLKDGPPFPAEPKVTLRLDSAGDPLADVQILDQTPVEKVEVFYTLGEKPSPNRFWRRAATVTTARSWQAKLPVVRTGDPLRAFANVAYRSGVCLSTNLARTTPDRLGSARASLEWSAEPAAEPDDPGAPFVYATANTDPNISPVYFVKSDDPQRPNAVCLNPATFGEQFQFGIVSHYLGDPGYAGRDAMSLTFEYRGEFPEKKAPKPGQASKKGGNEPPGLEVRLTAHDWTPQSKTYTARVSTPDAAAGWQTVALPVAKFVTDDGQPLRSWSDLDKIEIRGLGTRRHPPQFARFEWSTR
jgi:cephalosporin-C deacetylase-like acetyl esterase